MMACTGAIDQLHELRRAILDSPPAEGASGLDAVLRLCQQLPAPNAGPAGLVTECLYPVALAFDQQGDYPSAEALYLRALAHDEAPPWIAANIHYRAAICMQMQGKTDVQVSRHFQASAEHGAQIPEMRQLARYSLACLLLGSSDLAGAREYFRLLEDEPEPAIPQLDLLSRYLLCQVRLGEGDAAAQLLGKLPPIPSQADLGLLQVLFDAGWAAEQLRLYDFAGEIYGKILECDGLLPSLRANARFRLGLSMEFQSRWLDSIGHYKAAIDGSATCPEIGDLSRFHLALLFMAAEEYADAAELFQEMSQSTPLGARADVRVRHAVCLVQCREIGAAERILSGLEDAPLSLKAKIDQLLAEIHEGRKDYASAVACYTRIAQNPCAEVSIKWAAVQRMSSLNQS